MFQVWQWPSRIHFIRFHFLNVCKIRPSTFGGGEHEFLFGSPVFFTGLFRRKKRVTSLSSIEVVLSKSTKHKASTSWWRCGYGLLYDALKFSKKKYIYILTRVSVIEFVLSKSAKKAINFLVEVVMEL